MKGYAPARWLLIPSKVGLKPLLWATLAVVLPIDSKSSAQ